MARKIGLSSMIRVSSIVWSSLGPLKPGVMIGTTTGARMNSATAKTSRAISIRLITVETTRQARARSSVVNSAEMIGISADDRAPAATSWKIRSGIRNAAKNASSSVDGKALAMTTTRT